MSAGRREPRRKPAPEPASQQPGGGSSEGMLTGDREREHLLFDHTSDVVFATDADDRVAAERLQADQGRFIDAVLDIAGALVLVLDAQGRVVRFNGACERLSGFASEEVVGRQLWDIVIPPAEIHAVREAFADLRAGAFPNSYENHWRTRGSL